MKNTEFEKWYNQFNNSLTSKTEKKMQERAWRAALEWALNGEEDYCSFNQCVTADRIEEELE